MLSTHLIRANHNQMTSGDTIKVLKVLRRSVWCELYFATLKIYPIFRQEGRPLLFVKSFSGDWRPSKSASLPSGQLTSALHHPARRQDMGGSCLVCGRIYAEICTWSFFPSLVACRRCRSRVGGDLGPGERKWRNVLQAHVDLPLEHS